MEKFRIAGVLLEDPLGHSEAIPPAGARQVEYEIGPLVEAVLAANRLYVVAIEETPAETSVQLAQQVLLSPWIQPIDILRL